MNEITVSRLGCIVLSLFPALWGLFSLLNNTADFAGTARNAVGPLLAMQDTYQTPGLMWRAIRADWACMLGLAVITTLETLAGLFAAAGVALMIGRLKGPYAAFAKGKAWAMLGRFAQLRCGASVLWWSPATGSWPGRPRRIRWRCSWGR